MNADLRAAVAIARKDVSLWLRRPVAILTTLAPSLLYVLVAYYISAAVGTPPVAVVAAGSRPIAQRFVTAVRRSAGFRADVVTAARARKELDDMSVAGIVWVSASSDRRDQLGVTMQLNNLNQDIAGDLRRSLALTISDFASENGATPAVRVSERDTHATSITLGEFRMTTGLVLVLTIAGIVNTALAVCQEFERRTFDELALAPVHTWSLVLGKVIGGWSMALLVAAVLWPAGIAVGVLQAHGWYLVAAIAMTALVGLGAATVGVTVGVLLRQFQLASSVSIITSLYLFFLAGGISVLAFLPGWLQTAVHYDPLYYAIHALKQVELNSSLSGFARDALVMIAFALASAGVSLLSLTRRTADEPRATLRRLAR